MRLYKVDTLIKNDLFGKNLSIHHYARRAYLALQFIRTIQFDASWVVKSIELTVTDHYVIIPSDFLGVVRIGAANGQYIEELAPNNKLFLNEDIADEDNDGLVYWYPNVNKYGDNLGGYFGVSPTNGNSYKVLFDENKIMLDNSITATTIYLQYVTDGLESGKRTAVASPEPSVVYIHPYAVDAMFAYIEWKLPSDSRLISQNAERNYYNELRKARARLNPITAAMIIRSGRKHTKSSPKN